MTSMWHSNGCFCGALLPQNSKTNSFHRPNWIIMYIWALILFIQGIYNISDKANGPNKICSRCIIYKHGGIRTQNARWIKTPLANHLSILFTDFGVALHIREAFCSFQYNSQAFHFNKHYKKSLILSEQRISLTPLAVSFLGRSVLNSTSAGCN